MKFSRAFNLMALRTKNTLHLHSFSHKTENMPKEAIFLKFNFKLTPLVIVFDLNANSLLIKSDGKHLFHQ